jgi:hypothetical protein
MTPIIAATLAMGFAQATGVLLGWYLRGLVVPPTIDAREAFREPLPRVREAPPGWPMRGACSCEWQDGPARNEKTIVAHDPGCPIHGEGAGPS